MTLDDVATCVLVTVATCALIVAAAAHEQAQRSRRRAAAWRDRFDGMAETAAALLLERDAARLLARVRLASCGRLSAESARLEGEIESLRSHAAGEVAADRVFARIVAKDEHGRFRAVTGADEGAVLNRMLASAMASSPYRTADVRADGPRLDAA